MSGGGSRSSKGMPVLNVVSGQRRHANSATATRSGPGIRARFRSDPADGDRTPLPAAHGDAAASAQVARNGKARTGSGTRTRSGPVCTSWMQDAPQPASTVPPASMHAASVSMSNPCPLAGVQALALAGFAVLQALWPLAGVAAHALHGFLGHAGRYGRQCEHRGCGRCKGQAGTGPSQHSWNSPFGVDWLGTVRFIHMGAVSRREIRTRIMVTNRIPRGQARRIRGNADRDLSRSRTFERIPRIEDDGGFVSVPPKVEVPAGSEAPADPRRLIRLSCQSGNRQRRRPPAQWPSDNPRKAPAEDPMRWYS